jgi:hypothetical protein
MAKRKHNKSEAIRQLLASGTTNPAEIVAALAKKKIKVSPALIANVKARETQGKKRRKKKKASANGHLDLKTLLQAKGLIEATGSLDAAKKAIEMLGQLQAD